MSTGQIITADDYMSRVQPAKTEELRNRIIVRTLPLVVGAAEDLYTGEAVTIAAGETLTVNARYNKTPAIDVAAALSGETGSTFALDSETYYATRAAIVIENTGATSGTVVLTVTGKPLVVEGSETVIVEDAASILEHGLRTYEVADNAMIQTREMAEEIADGLLASYKTARRDTELEWRGNPAIELGDPVVVPEYTRQGLNYQGTFAVVRNGLQFDGTLRATLEGRKVGTEWLG